MDRKLSLYDICMTIPFLCKFLKKSRYLRFVVSGQNDIFALENEEVQW